MQLLIGLELMPSRPVTFVVLILLSLHLTWVIKRDSLRENDCELDFVVNEGNQSAMDVLEV